MQLSNSLSKLNRCFISSNTFNNSLRFFDRNDKPEYFFCTLFEKSIYLQQNFGFGHIFFTFLCSFFLFRKRYWPNKGERFLLINTSVINFRRACFARYVKIFKSSLNSCSPPRLWQTVLVSIGFRNPLLLR